MTPRITFGLLLAALSALVATLLFFIDPARAAEPGTGAGPLDPAVVQWGFIAAAASAGISSTAAAFAVARVGSAAVGALAEKPELFGRVIVLVGLAEGIAIYGLIVSILVLNSIG
jgi:V/A-type H+-transporting ATPase subunit K